MKNFFIIIAFLFTSATCFAGGGMWLPHLLKALNESEMQAMGIKLSAEDIYDVNKGSLKDAIVHFGGFCTSEIVSPNGLLLTNHHCGYSQIQSHTTLENNYIRDGFWAMSLEDELPNPGLSAIFIHSLTDVTDLILEGVTDDMTPKERQSAIDKNISAYKKSTNLEKYQKSNVRAFFKGNQFIDIITITYPDVRLVGAPPEMIGKFGSDTDNWVWPRHTGDFSFFRIYADADNNPAEYSEDNVPFKPKKFLPISLDGAEEGDFTMVFGFPGRTNEYLPGIAVDQIANVVNPHKIFIRETALGIIDKEMKNDPAIKIKYASKYARVANYWKKWIGESLGINKSDALTKKRSDEVEFKLRLRDDEKLQEKYGDVLPRMKKLYEERADYAVADAIHSEAFLGNVEFVRFSGILGRLAKMYENNGEEVYNQSVGRYKSYFEKQYKDYESYIDKNVFLNLSEVYMDRMPRKFITPELKVAMMDLKMMMTRREMTPFLQDGDKVLSAMDTGAIFVRRLNGDPIVKKINEIKEIHGQTVGKRLRAIDRELNDLMSRYMKAQMEVFDEKRFYPDANSTMRVTYGQVKGYAPRDGVYYNTHTFLEGVMEKYKPGDYEFDVPEKLQELFHEKDYGPYAVNGKVPVCFIGSNHTTGGNSGSPAIDAYGNLIGLNFDRVWEGTMSDLNYDPEICRNIMVDVRYILFIVDKYAGATHLIEEMELVHPKKDDK